MKNKLVTSIATMVIVGMISFGASAFASIVTVDKGVNFRSAPNTSSTVYSMIKTGTKLTVISQPNKYWYYVSYDGKKGYVSANYVTSDGSVIEKPATPAPSAKASAIVNTAKKYLGVPYLYGSKFGDNSTFDCSDFTKTVFGDNGIYLPRNSRQQYSFESLTPVSKSNLKVGDLVFFSTRATVNRTGLEKVGHVGIYIGNGDMIHTYGAGGVKVTSMSDNWWVDHYIGARRVLK